MEAFLSHNTTFNAIALAQVLAPELDAMYVVNLLARVLHILGAIVLVGGIAYLTKVVAPGAARRGSDSPELLYGDRRAAWAKWVGIAAALLLATGFYNYILIIKNYQKMPGAYHMFMGIKMLLALVVMFLAAILAGKTEAADRFRGKAGKWLTICLAAGIAIVLLAGVLRSFPHLPK